MAPSLENFGSYVVGVLSVAALTAAGWIIVGFVKRDDIKKKIRSLQAARDAKFAELKKKFSGADGQALLTPGRKEIRNLGFSDLRSKLQSGMLKAVDVLDAYTACALAVTQETNCVVDFIDEAQGWAAALDELGPGVGGPLHGIPVSVKENFSVCGYDSTYGVGKRISLPASKDCTIVAVLKNLGAVPFCRTNIPQTMISFGCGNPIYGRSENPYQSGRTTGGSSAGEGCLIGAGGSILGVGSDVGGSVRIPAAFCGCSSLKPTVGRLSALGMNEPLNDLCGMSSTAGFMARSTDALEVVYAEVSRSQLHRKLDPCMPDLKPIELAVSQDESRPLVIGICEEDGYFPPTPGMRRAVQVVKTMLQKRGHRVVSFNIPDAEYAFKLYTDMIKADGLTQFAEAMDGEPVDPAVRLNMIAARTPHFLDKLLAPLVKTVSPKTALLLKGGARDSVDLWRAVHQAREYRQRFVEKWRDEALDVLVCPAFPLPAPPHKYCSFLLTAACYTALFNLIDLPAGVVPVTLENEEDQKELQKYPIAADRMHGDAYKATKGAGGLPLAVQVVGLPWTEATVLRAMKEIEVELQAAGATELFLHSRQPWSFPPK